MTGKANLDIKTRILPRGDIKQSEKHVTGYSTIPVPLMIAGYWKYSKPAIFSTTCTIRIINYSTDGGFSRT